MRFSLNQLPIGLFIALLTFLTGHASVEAPKLQACLETAQTPLAKLECFRGIPYRADGALDEYSRWTTWADQSQEFASAGLNCSGFTTAASQALWGQSLFLNQARHDRLNDSGPQTAMGEDWDFGLDLILNLTDKLPRRLVPNPYENQNLDSSSWSAHDLRGVDIENSAFAEMLAQLQPQHIYYFAISKPDSRFKGDISFYHVDLILKDGPNIWMYHATAKGGVYRVNLAGENGVAWIRRFYSATPRGSRYMQLVEVPLASPAATPFSAS